MIITKEKINKTLIPPVIFIDLKKSEIDVRTEKFISCSKGLVNQAYKNVYIVDSIGNHIKIKKVIATTGSIKFWTSIKYFSSMIEVITEVDKDFSILSLSKFKELLINTVKEKPKYWVCLDSIGVIIKSINNSESYIEIMRIFNSKIK